MYLDVGNRFSNGQLVTADALSTDWIDRGAPAAPFDAQGDDSVSAGEPMDLIVHVTSAADFNPLTSCQITLESDAVAAMTTAPVVHLDRTFLAAALVAGRKHTVGRLDPGLKTQQFLRVRFNVIGGDATTGAIDCYLIRAKDNEAPIAPAVPLS